MEFSLEVSPNHFDASALHFPSEKGYVQKDMLTYSAALGCKTT